MSQQTVFTIATLPEEDIDMGDIEYLARIANGELATGQLVTLIGKSNTTEVLGTVPGGKDWYLADYAVIGGGATNGSYSLEYPTGNEIQSFPLGTVGLRTVLNAPHKGLKLTTGQTITITKPIAVSSITTMEIVEVDTGVSPKLT